MTPTILLISKKVKLCYYLIEYQINIDDKIRLINQLSVLGVSGANIFPDLHHVGSDRVIDIGAFDVKSDGPVVS